MATKKKAAPKEKKVKLQEIKREVENHYKELWRLKKQIEKLCRDTGPLQSSMWILYDEDEEFDEPRLIYVREVSKSKEVASSCVCSVIKCRRLDTLENYNHIIYKQGKTLKVKDISFNQPDIWDVTVDVEHINFDDGLYRIISPLEILTIYGFHPNALLRAFKDTDGTFAIIDGKVVRIEGVGIDHNNLYGLRF